MKCLLCSRNVCRIITGPGFRIRYGGTLHTVKSEVRAIPSSAETPERLPDIHEGPPNLAESNGIQWRRAIFVLSYISQEVSILLRTVTVTGVTVVVLGIEVPSIISVLFQRLCYGQG
jgi:hypothetical protein